MLRWGDRDWLAAETNRSFPCFFLSVWSLGRFMTADEHCLEQKNMPDLSRLMNDPSDRPHS